MIRVQLVFMGLLTGLIQVSLSGQIQRSGGSGPGRFFNASPAARCAVLNDWTELISKTNIDVSVPQLMAMSDAAFRPEVFSRYFGKSYLDLSDDELTSIHVALKTCFRDAWRPYRLVAAFQSLSNFTTIQWRERVAAADRSQTPSQATNEARGTIRAPLIFESSDALIYNLGCGTDSGSFTSVHIVFRKPPEFEITAENPEYRRLYERTLHPAILARCPQTVAIAAENYVAGVHIENFTLVESPQAPKRQPERPVNDMIITRRAGTFDYRMSSFAERSLADVRGKRQQSEQAAQQKQAGEQQKAQAAKEADDAARIARGKLRETVLASLAQDRSPAKQWYRSMMVAKGITRGKLLEQLGTVSLSYSPMSIASFTASQQDAAIRAALQAIGLRVDPRSPFVMQVSLEGGGGTLSAKASKGDDVASSKSEVVWVWGKAELKAPATVQRESGFYRTSATLAAGMGAGIEVGGKPTGGAVNEALSGAISSLARDAGLDRAPAISDVEWMDALAPHANDSTGRYASYLETAKLGGGNAPMTAGIGNVLRVDTGIAEGNRLLPLEIRAPGGLYDTIAAYLPAIARQFIQTGDKLWNLAPRWHEALAGAGVAVGTPTLAPGFLPVLSHTISGTGRNVAELLGMTTSALGLMGQAMLREPNCLVRIGGVEVRVECASAVFQGFNVDVGIKDALDANTDDARASIAGVLTRDRTKVSPGTAIVPPVENNVRNAYERLNNRRLRADQLPLIYQSGGGTGYVAGLEKATGDFKRIAMPTSRTMERAMVDGNRWLRTNAGKPGVSLEILLNSLKKRYEGYEFLESNYGMKIDDLPAFAAKVEKAAVIRFDAPRQ